MSQFGESTNSQPAPRRQLRSAGEPLQVAFAAKVLSLGQASEATIANYRRHVRHFLAFCRNSGGLRLDSVLAFKAHLAKRADLSVGSKNQFLAVAKIYTASLFNLRLISADISKDIAGRPIKGFQDTSLHKKDGFTASELARIRDCLAGLDGSWRSCRLRAMLALLQTQGAALGRTARPRRRRPRFGPQGRLDPRQGPGRQGAHLPDRPELRRPGRLAGRFRHPLRPALCQRRRAGGSPAPASRR